jgi:predicted nucleic acid-binding protein
VIVVDTSVALKWIIAEDGHELARMVRGVDRDMVAPHLLVSELCSALRKNENRGTAPPQDAIDKALAAVLNDILELVDDRVISKRAMELSRLLDHSVYDCFFLAASEPGGVLVTADEKLAAKVTGLERPGYTMSLCNCSNEGLDALCALAASDSFVHDSGLLGLARRFEDYIAPTRKNFSKLMSDISKRRLELNRDSHVINVASFDLAKAFDEAVEEFPARRALQRLNDLGDQQLADLMSIFVLGSDYDSLSNWIEAKDTGRFIGHQLRREAFRMDWLKIVLPRWSNVTRGADMIRALSAEHA